MTRIAIALLLAITAAVPAKATEAGWALLRDGGQVVLLRHAMISGTHEPANFDISKCATQRNLSARGQQQARRIGALFAARAAEVERVLSSRYCRSLDTARLAFEAEPEPFEALVPAPPESPEFAARKKAIIEEVANFTGAGNLIMVTDLEVIKALTGVSPREGEATIVRADGDTLRVIGRIIFN